VGWIPEDAPCAFLKYHENFDPATAFGAPTRRIVTKHIASEKQL